MRQRRMSGWLWITDSNRRVAHFRVNIVRNEERTSLFSRDHARESQPGAPYDETVMVGTPPPY